MDNWILTSERLPDKNCKVLATVVYINRESIDILNFLTDEDEEPGFYHDDRDLFRLDNDDVVAWMPLPKPYRKEV